MRRSAGFAMALVASAGLMACPDDYGTTDAPAADAAVPLGDAMGAPVEDAGANAKVEAATPSSSWCATHDAGVLCADFDESADPAAGWSGTIPTNGATLTVDKILAAPSPPNAFVASTPMAGLLTARAALAKTVRASAVKPLRHVRLSADVNVLAAKPMGLQAVYFFDVAFENGPHIAAVVGDSYRVVLHVENQPKGNIGMLAPNTWSRYTLDVTAGAGEVSTLTNGNQTVSAPTFSGDAGSMMQATAIATISVGVGASPGNPASSFAFDNVVIEAE